MKLSILDLLWFTLLCAVCCAWYADKSEGPPPKIIPDSLRKTIVTLHPGVSERR